MNFLTTLYVLYVKVREVHRGLSKGQTMTEYALILAAVAVVVFVTYEVMGQDISALVNVIDSDLSAAAS
jgi:Flp pilus assembly pilin Flp